MRALLQDIIEKDSNEMQISRCKMQDARKNLKLVSSLFLDLSVASVFRLVVCYLLLVTVVFAQQPVQQKSLEEERLKILKADIQKEIEELKKLKKEIEDAQKALDEKSQEKLAKVAKMYESMLPEEAARKLEKLDEDTAVIILNSLKPKTAGKILAQMENEKAASLSKKLLIKGRVLQEKTSR